MLDPHLVILAAAIGSAGPARYVWEIVHGQVQPNRISFACFAAAPLIAAAAQLSEGVRWPALLTLQSGTTALIIVMASFIFKTGAWKLNPFDVLCGTGSILALVAWWLTRAGDVAVILSITSDALASAPTVRKTYLAPKTEDPWAWLMGVPSGLLTLATIPAWSVGTAAFPIYIAGICGLIAAMAFALPLVRRST